MLSGYLKDIILAIAFFIYPFLLLLVSKTMERTGVRKDTSRKFVHVAMGLVILFVHFFDHKWIAVIPPLIFTAINAVDYKLGIFSQIQGEEKGNVGTILYPISFVVLIWTFYGTKWWGLAVLGVLALAFGDAGASIIGRQFGKTIYLVSGEVRSYAGSATMLVLTWIAAILVFLVYGPTMGLAMQPGAILATGFIVAFVSTAVEALSIRGTDNLTVPLLTALTAWLVIAVLAPIIQGNQNIVNQPLFQ
jgi:phytol kinase